MEQQNFAEDARRHSVAWLFTGVLGAASLQEAFLSCTLWPYMTNNAVNAVRIWDQFTRNETLDLTVLLLVQGNIRDTTEVYWKTLMENLDVFENTQPDESRRHLLHLTKPVFNDGRGGAWPDPPIRRIHTHKKCVTRGKCGQTPTHPHAIRSILKTGLDLTQKIVDEDHKRLQTNVWIVNLSATYNVLQFGLDWHAMIYVFREVLHALREHKPYNDPRRQITDAERWHICRIIAADWTIWTLSIASTQSRHIYDNWARPRFFNTIPPASRWETPDENVSNHLANAMEQSFTDATRDFHFDINGAHLYYAIITLLYQNHHEYAAMLIDNADVIEEGVVVDGVDDDDSGGDDSDEYDMLMVP